MSTFKQIQITARVIKYEDDRFQPKQFIIRPLQEISWGGGIFNPKLTWSPIAKRLIKDAGSSQYRY